MTCSFAPTSRPIKAFHFPRRHEVIPEVTRKSGVLGRSVRL